MATTSEILKAYNVKPQGKDDVFSFVVRGKTYEYRWLSSVRWCGVELPLKGRYRVITNAGRMEMTNVDGEWRRTYECTFPLNDKQVQELAHAITSSLRIGD